MCKCETPVLSDASHVLQRCAGLKTTIFRELAKPKLSPTSEYTFFLILTKKAANMNLITSPQRESYL